MSKNHRIISWLIVICVFLIAFFSKARMTDTTAQILVTFLSVVFGFYTTSIAILFKSAYVEKLYSRIDEKRQQRQIYILKRYLLLSGYCSIASVISIALFTSYATKDVSGVLSINFEPLTLLKKPIDLNYVLNSGIFGLVALNIFFMILILRLLIESMVEESKKS